MAGPFLSGTVCAYRVSGGAKGAQLGSCTVIVSATSSFSIDVGSYLGDVLVEVTNATYDDEANPNDDVAGTPLTCTLRNLVRIATVGGTLDLAVTPLTEAALRLAGGTLSDASMQARSVLRRRLDRYRAERQYRQRHVQRWHRRRWGDRQRLDAVDRDRWRFDHGYRAVGQGRSDQYRPERQPQQERKLG